MTKGLTEGCSSDICLCVCHYEISCELFVSDFYRNTNFLSISITRLHEKNSLHIIEIINYVKFILNIFFSHSANIFGLFRFGLSTISHYILKNIYSVVKHICLCWVQANITFFFLFKIMPTLYPACLYFSDDIGPN